jgi:hypothetical protein
MRQRYFEAKYYREFGQFPPAAAAARLDEIYIDWLDDGQVTFNTG